MKLWMHNPSAANGDRYTSWWNVVSWIPSRLSAGALLCSLSLSLCASKESYQNFQTRIWTGIRPEKYPNKTNKPKKIGWTSPMSLQRERLAHEVGSRNYWPAIQIQILAGSSKPNQIGLTTTTTKQTKNKNKKTWKEITAQLGMTHLPNCSANCRTHSSIYLSGDTVKQTTTAAAHSPTTPVHRSSS